MERMILGAVLGLVQVLRWGLMLGAALLLFRVLAGEAAGPWTGELVAQVQEGAVALGPRALTGLGALAVIWILARW